MRNKFIPAILLASAAAFFLGGPVLADPVDVEDGWIFLADGDLFVYSEDDTIEPKKTYELETATDVLVDDCKAVVTTEDDQGVKGVVVVDLAEEAWCSDDADDESQCIAEFNPSENELSIPCVDAFGDSYTVHMKRRGNSDNWYVSFIDENDDENDDENEDEDNDEDDEDEDDEDDS
jgi:hypothetical protein